MITINVTTFNSTAIFSCDVGYELNGSLYRTCLASGNWSESQPSCNGKYRLKNKNRNLLSLPLVNWMPTLSEGSNLTRKKGTP